MGASQGRSTLDGRKLGLLGVFGAVLVGLAMTGPVQDEAGDSQARAQELRKFYVNTTEDKGVNSRHCLPGQDCPFRAALEFAHSPGGGIITACFDPEEIEGVEPCPAGKKPLSFRDRGYDADAGRWVIEFPEGGATPYVLSGDGIIIDFTLGITDWNGPEDNRIVLDAGRDERPHGIIIEGPRNQIAGFELRGKYSNSAIVVRRGQLALDDAIDNVIGPGMILAGIEPGVGLKVLDPETTGTRIVGSWCGVTGDGTEATPMRDDCIQIMDGARNSVVGGPDPADRNVFAASTLGSGISVQGFQPGAGGDDPAPTLDNRIEGNWIGLLPSGRPAGNAAGITIKLDAQDTQVLGNVIAGNQGPGIAIFNESTGTRIENNFIGLGIDGCAPNDGSGIDIQARPRDTHVEGNEIACNAFHGVSITGQRAVRNRVTRNRIYQNGNEAISVAQGANGGIRPPQLGAIGSDWLAGSACANCSIEIYSDTEDEASVLEGVGTADASGAFQYQGDPFSLPFITLLAIDAEGNTSALSQPARLPRETPSATPAPTVEATPTRDPDALSDIYMPLALESLELKDLPKATTVPPEPSDTPGSSVSPTPTEAGPTVTPTIGATPTPSITPTPRKPVPGRIHGRLTVGGKAAELGLGSDPGPGLILERCRAAEADAEDPRPVCRMIDRTGVADAQGNFEFTDPQEKDEGEFYRVTWINESEGIFFGTDLWLGVWYSRPIEVFEAGQEVDLGRIELADIPLTDPLNGIGTFLPIEFKWGRRSSETGNYYLAFCEAPCRNIEERGTFHKISVGRRGSYRMGSRPPGMRVGIDFRYFWFIRVEGEDGSYGESFYARMFWLEGLAR